MSEVPLREKLVAILGSEGVTYKSVAEKAKCDTSTIFRIKNGDISNPSYSVGSAIDAMYEEHLKREVA